MRHIIRVVWSILIHVYGYGRDKPNSHSYQWKMFLFPSRYEIRTSVRVKVLTVLSSVLTSYGHWYEVSLCAVVQVMSNATGGLWMQLIISSSAAWSALNYWYSLVEVPFRRFLLRPHKTVPEGCIMIFHFELSTNQIFFSSAILCMVSFCTLVFSWTQRCFCFQTITSKAKKRVCFSKCRGKASLIQLLKLQELCSQEEALQKGKFLTSVIHNSFVLINLRRKSCWSMQCYHTLFTFLKTKM